MQELRGTHNVRSKKGSTAKKDHVLSRLTTFETPHLSSLLTSWPRKATTCGGRRARPVPPTKPRAVPTPQKPASLCPLQLIKPPRPQETEVGPCILVAPMVAVVARCLHTAAAPDKSQPVPRSPASPAVCSGLLLGMGNIWSTAQPLGNVTACFVACPEGLSLVLAWAGAGW